MRIKRTGLISRRRRKKKEKENKKKKSCAAPELCAVSIINERCNLRLLSLVAYGGVMNVILRIEVLFNNYVLWPCRRKRPTRVERIYGSEYP
ncbi:hypothetical protein CEXT_798091 [Caerostris extrusa]|uniref:Uncharacterized protein n=1 Tax=Caerostris extrusa TaxID=172846 RepID=A0AAV4V850_CAEEX|nr:hypothetical protein CEXT_798091 [Caerostris extrusa]